MKLSEEELKDLDCRDSDYEYEEVVVSKDFGYSKLYEEYAQNTEIPKPAKPNLRV